MFIPPIPPLPDAVAKPKYFTEEIKIVCASLTDDQLSKSMIGLMPKVGMPIFDKCQMLASDWLTTNFSSQPHKKLSTFGNF